MSALQILFENNDFIVIDKPSGVLSVPSRVGEKETRPIIGKILENELNIKIFPVHRLDAEVSGILLFAKNAHAHREANQVFEKHWVQKTYEALSLASEEFFGPSAHHEIRAHAEKLSRSKEELPAKGSHFEWRSKILRGKKRAYESPVGKDALTRAKIKSKLDWQGHPALLWELEPVTGRSHQLRFEMARHKVPIIGDVLYGSTLSLNHKKPSEPTSANAEKLGSDFFGGIALRAVKIDFSEAHKKNLLKTLPPLIQAKDLLGFLS